ncbi:PaaI family thioesterase [candidate division WOR-3 bacterium]|nr:PaaI family thioesterase [candidate division WOR-3 bacterium]
MTTDYLLGIPDSHKHCMLCGEENPSSMRLRFHGKAEGSVWADFDCGKKFQGYEGYLHGGIICSLLDCAMAHCLFSLNISAFTAELNVRFLKPVPVGSKIFIKATLKNQFHNVYFLNSSISLGDDVFARAEGKFMESKEPDPLKSEI